MTRQEIGTIIELLRSIDQRLERLEKISERSKQVHLSAEDHYDLTQAARAARRY